MLFSQSNGKLRERGREREREVSIKMILLSKGLKFPVLEVVLIGDVNVQSFSEIIF